MVAQRPSGQTRPVESKKAVLPERESVDIEEFLRWMRLAEGELPPGIKRHIGYRPGNLTALASLEHNGALWELYLLARLPVRELHIVIAQGDKTFYLIDRSFQREGRSFRSGYARRDRGVIMGVVSEERAAASKEAVQFYDVFLTWWDRERLRF